MRGITCIYKHIVLTTARIRKSCNAGIVRVICIIVGPLYRRCFVDWSVIIAVTLDRVQSGPDELLSGGEATIN